MTWETDAPIGELLNGDQIRWPVGVCAIRALDDKKFRITRPGVAPTYLEVVGEGHHRIDIVDTRIHSPHEVDERLSEAIYHEHREL